MKAVVASVLGALFVMLHGCAEIDTRSAFDPKYGFRQLRVYAWLPAHKDESIKHIDVERARRAVDKDLTFKGFRLAAEDPDFLIAMSIGGEHPWAVAGDAAGWNRSSGTPAVLRARPNGHQEGTLKLSFIDPKTNEIFWQGEVSGLLRERPAPETVEAWITQAVGRLLRDFPPKQRRGP